MSETYPDSSIRSTPWTLRMQSKCGGHRRGQEIVAPGRAASRVLVEIWSDSVIEPKREPRPGAEWSGLRSARPRRLVKDTDHDQGTKDHQSQGWFVGACQAAW